MHETIYRRNLILRASSIGSKFTANPTGGTDQVMTSNLLIDNNLYVEGELGIGAGGNTDNNNGHRWKNILITKNVLFSLGRSRPTNRALGWGTGVNDWDGGKVLSNVLATYGSAQVPNIYAISVKGHTRNVQLTDNLVHGLNSSSRHAVIFDSAPKSGITFSGNELQFAGMQMLFKASRRRWLHLLPRRTAVETELALSVHRERCQ